MSGPRVVLPGSSLSREGREHWISAADPGQEITATIVLRRRASAAKLGEELLAGTAKPVSREEAGDIGADPQELAVIEKFAESNGLKIAGENAAARTLRVEGAVQQMESAFGVKLAWFEDAEGHRFLSYQGAISIPEGLQGVIVAVLGLDRRPAAQPRC